VVKLNANFLTEYAGYDMPVGEQPTMPDRGLPQNKYIQPSNTHNKPFGTEVEGSFSSNVELTPAEKVRDIVKEFIIKLIDNSKGDMKVLQDDEFISLIKNEKVFMRFFRDIKYDKKKIIITYDIAYTNDDIMEIQDTLHTFSQGEPDIEFRIAPDLQRLN